MTSGGPAALAADGQAAQQLADWGGRWLNAEKVQRLLEAARGSIGVRLGELESHRLQQDAGQALAARQQMRLRQRQLGRLVRGRAVLEAHARVVGCATACVLWASVGDPRDYPCGAAYRKAMGLNLSERSSGTNQGKLHISKRGNPRARQWLYFAAMRLVKHAEVRSWYQAKKSRDGHEVKRALVGVMRKLVLALYQVGVHGTAFEAWRLFPGQTLVPQPVDRSSEGNEECVRTKGA